MNKKLKLFTTFTIIFVILSSNKFISFAQQKDLEIQGFKKIKSEFVSDYQTNADTYEHIKTAAKVLVINNGDEEKFFTIGFKTPPVDNSGATHVFEHTTLQGSKNYPVKSMLTRLGSTSMATYFNAATADDFTFYPFGSLNEKDYYNLMNIYLDGIFYPMVMTDKNVFKRDGVRMDLKDGHISYNGVVYNEMKNSTSNINSILYNSIKQSLYPDTYYKYVAGGEPEAITDLTYEKIIELHDKAYHPSNSLTVLYGEQDINKSLELLDDYFRDFDKRENNFELGYQVPYTELQKYYADYPISQDNISSNSIMSLNYVIPETHNYEQTMIDFILLDLLMSSDTSPLKKAISQSGITNSLGVTSNYTQINQGSISFYSMNINSKYENQFVWIIENALKQIKEEGFEENYIESVFNAYEYNQSSSINSKNKGYEASISAISGWMYNNDATRMMDNKAILAKLKKNINSEMFETLIDELFLNNNFKSLVIINPNENFQAEKSKALTNKLNQYAENLTQTEILQLTSETEEFYKWQNTPDSSEVLAIIPSLDIKDISNNQKDVECSLPQNINGATLIQTYINTNDISNIVLSFDAQTIPQKKLQYLQLMASLLGDSATKNYTKQKLAQQKLNYLGSFTADLKSIKNIRDESFSPRFDISIKTLEANEEEALKLINEILINSDFDDKSLVKKNLQQLKLYYEQSLSELSVPLAQYLSEAMTSEEGKLKDYIEGYEFYNFVTDALDHIDDNWVNILKELEEVKTLIFNKNNLIIGYTNTKDKQDNFIKNINPLINSLASTKNKTQKLKFKDYGNAIAVTAPTSTLSINQVGNLKDLGFKYNGNMDVLSKIVSKGYLWGYIREQGGAYHTAMNINSNGLIRLLSYADPNLMDTIKVYLNVPLFLENIKDIPQETLDSFIISTASSIDNSLRDYNLWDYGINNYITGYSLDNIYTKKHQILNTKVKDISNYADIFKKLNSNAKYIVIGNTKIIDENSDIFDKIIKLN